jgi:hypothetical protein
LQNIFPSLRKVILSKSSRKRQALRPTVIGRSFSAQTGSWKKKAIDYI